MGRLEFIDTDKKLYELLAQHTSYTTELRFCFEVDRLIGKHKIEKRQYCHVTFLGAVPQEGYKRGGIT